MLTGSRIVVRFWEAADAEEKLELELRNREFFQAFAATRDESFYTLAGQQKRIQQSVEGKGNDQQYAFGVYLLESQKLIGTVALTEVLRGALQSCYIGYFLDKEYNGQGFMTEAVRLVVSYAFEELNLHRLEAGVMPHNLGSIRVLEKAGFHKEGIAKKNVKINGTWQDHQVLAIINENE